MNLCLVRPNIFILVPFYDLLQVADTLRHYCKSMPNSELLLRNHTFQAFVNCIVANVKITRANVSETTDDKRSLNSENSLLFFLI